MTADLDNDPKFFERADAYINLANAHCGEAGRGKVSASFLYGCSRFQAWNAACWAEDGKELQARRDETVKYFVEQYQKMLEENLDDYIKHYAKYMEASR